MLTDFFIKIINLAFDFIAKFKPDLSSVNSAFENVSGSIDTIIDFVEQVNFIVPLDTILVIIGIEVTIHVAIFAMFMIDKIRQIITSIIP